MAKMLFWYCSKCGFKNHPRLPTAGKPDAPIDDQKCEQCGTSATDPLTPGFAIAGP